MRPPQRGILIALGLGVCVNVLVAWAASLLLPYADVDFVIGDRNRTEPWRGPADVLSDDWGQLNLHREFHSFASSGYSYSASRKVLFGNRRETTDVNGGRYVYEDGEYHHVNFAEIRVGWPVRSMRYVHVTTDALDYQLLLSFNEQPVNTPSSNGVLVTPNSPMGKAKLSAIKRPLILGTRSPQMLEGPIGLYALPLSPMFLGIVANSLLYGGALWCAVAVCALWKARRRRRRGLCPRCAYDISGLRRCPECGHNMGVRPAD